MSKLYKKYLSLKEKNSKMLYGFKCGIFFLFLEDDAKIMSSTFHLKLTNLNEKVVKCGFPVSHIEKYLSLIGQTSYQIELVNLETDQNHKPKQYLANESIISLLNRLSSLNSDQISVSEAYQLLEEFHNEAQQIKKEVNYESI